MDTREEYLTIAGTLIYDQIIAPVAVVREGERWQVLDAVVVRTSSSVAVAPCVAV